MTKQREEHPTFNIQHSTLNIQMAGRALRARLSQRVIRTQMLNSESARSGVRALPSSMLNFFRDGSEVKA